MVASEAKLDVKILKFTTQITRAHAHHQGRVINFGASARRKWRQSAARPAKSTSTCRPCPCSLLFIPPTSASLRLSGGRRWKIVELNVECLPPRGQAREREREAREGEASGKLGKLSVCPELPAPAARHYVQGPRRPRPGSAGEGERGRPRTETGLWPSQRCC